MIGRHALNVWLSCDDSLKSQSEHYLSTKLRPRTRWKRSRMWTIFLLLLLSEFSAAIKNKFYTISELCQRSQQSFLSNIPHLIDGAVISSSNERDMDCVVTFQTESILEKFMIRFEELKIDCNDQLMIFDGAHAIGAPKVSISCDRTIASIGKGGSVYTQTNFFTMKYVTDSWGTDMHGFKMVVTAFKDSHKNGCRDGFQCEHNNICIDNDLVCDTINHCSDGEDERSSQFCTPLGFPAWMVMDTPAIVGVVFCGIFLVLAAITALILYSWRKRETLEDPRTTAYQINSGKSMNGIRLDSGEAMTAASNNTIHNHHAFAARQSQFGQNVPPPAIVIDAMQSKTGTMVRHKNGGGHEGAFTMMTTPTSTLVATAPGSGNGMRPAEGRGYKNCNIQVRHLFWLPL